MVSVCCDDSACTDKFVDGGIGINLCPAGYELISSEATCEAAASDLGLNYCGTISDFTGANPRGCFRWETHVSYNSDPHGYTNMPSTMTLARVCIFSTGQLRIAQY